MGEPRVDVVEFVEITKAAGRDPADLLAASDSRSASTTLRRMVNAR
ncbi:MAG: hypothetical protein ACREUG_09620 [Steroidobacteraceae bacterium]